MLSVTDLDVAYGDILAVRQLSFQVEQGRIVALVGSNGAGKTTALSAISGLTRIKSGSIIFDGRDVTRMPAHQIVDLGLIHVPEGRRLFPFMTVRENLELGAFGRAARKQRSRQLDYVFSILPKLRQRSQQLAGTLSGGEQQMCAIGRGLMSCPRLFMLDEPTLGLAPMLVEDLFALVRTIRDSGIPVLLVEQQVVHALECSDHAIVLETGRCVMQGPGRDLLRDDGLRRAYLVRVAEPEFAFRMAADLPPRAQAYAVEEVLAAVAALHPAIEVPDSRFADFTRVGAAQLIADNACADRFVLGPPADAVWRDLDLAAHRVIATAAGRPPSEGSGANVLGDPRLALAWLVNELSSLQITLAAGAVVTTGTATTPLPIGPGDAVTADFGALGRVTARFLA